ncbi:unnamed protein product [Acanthoscelides obtectus]|uniref:Uncharacterized protein n=1 Tax=Acanthoscelides obtectus TaxID=200917 RepID=A0A9P0JIH8_ACAOB|nr:unnamed protein product [Acanthoscelides obtectus]CAK1624928.1 hypothetical protein AOBTE_LOCUS2855 [Acanthoscelides obtectus]
MKFLITNSLVILVAVSICHCQDYEDDYELPPARRPAPARVQPNYSGPAKNENRAPPVAILKQINRHNEDGSYTYGYESGDGTFKIETKLPNGEVKGKYGYVDDTGKVRVVEYGATKHGFAPAGEGITVPPPTLVDERPQSEQEEEYYEPQQVEPVRPAITAAKLRPRPKAQPAFESYSPPQQFEPINTPVPRRPQIAGAAPTPVETQTFDFGPVSRPSPARSFSPAPKPRPAPVQFAQPAPVENGFELRPRPAKITYVEPVERSEQGGGFASFEPAPRPAPRPAPSSFAPRPSASSYAPRKSAVPANGRTGGILDQLSKDYALPSDGAPPLHDISFGYY